MMNLETYKAACTEMGFADKLKNFDKYINLLLEWNKKMNLVGRQQTADRIYHHHLLDCLLVANRLDPNWRVVDVGSGAGFPAICWGLAIDGLRVTMVEKSPKKCTFLKHAVDSLGLGDRVMVMNQSVQDVCIKGDIISCRAFTSAHDFLIKTHHIGGAKTQWWMLKARLELIQQELLDIDLNYWQAKILPLHHPTQDLERHLVNITPR